MPYVIKIKVKGEKKPKVAEWEHSGLPAIFKREEKAKEFNRRTYGIEARHCVKDGKVLKGWISATVTKVPSGFHKRYLKGKGFIR